MKKLILIYLFFFPLFVSAKIDYKKFIEKHDIMEETKNLPNDDPADFWNSSIKSPSFQKFFKDIQKGKGAEKEAFKQYNSFPKFNPKYNTLAIDSCENLINLIREQIGFIESIEVCIIDDSSFNAFTTPGDKGHVIGVNYGVFEQKGVTPEIIFGVIAHEYAHATMFHILQSEYAKAKRKRRNDLLTGVTAGLNVAAAGIDSYTSALLGTEAHTDDYIQAINELPEKAAEDLEKYKYKYSREQEFEADLIAYRFMEWAGYGGENYIEVLKIINNVEIANGMVRLTEYEDDTHPTTQERIHFIEFVKAHPEIGNKENEKILKRELKSQLNKYDDIYK